MAPNAGPRILIALGAVYLFWGATYFAIRVAVTEIPPFLLASWRHLTAGCLLYAVLRLRGTARPTLRQWGHAAIVGGLLLAVANGLVGVVEQWVSSGLVAVFMATIPLWSALLGWAWGERPVRADWWGIAFGTTGVVVLQFGQGLHGAAGAMALIVLAALCWAFGSVLSKRLELPKGLMGSAAQMVTGGLLLIPFSLASGESWPTTISPASWWALAYLIVFGSLIGYSCYLHVLAHLRPAVAMSNTYVNPIVALLLGTTLGQERLSPGDWVGSLIVLAAVVILIGSKQGPKTAPRPAALVRPESSS